MRIPKDGCLGSIAAKKTGGAPSALSVPYNKHSISNQHAWTVPSNTDGLEGAERLLTP